MFNSKIRSRIRSSIMWGIILLITSFGASLPLLVIEQEANNPKFRGLKDLYWWWLNTVTGIGSDAVPITLEGRIIASFIIFAGLALLGLVISEFTAILKMIYSRKEDGHIQIRYRNHIVIFGYTSLTAGVIKLLHRHFGSETRIVLISNDVRSNPFPGQVDFIYGNPISSSTFVDANITRALAAIILANDRFRDPDTYSLVIAAGVAQRSDKLASIVELVDNDKRDLFKKTKIDAFINRKELLNDLLEGNPNPKLMRIISKESKLVDKIDESFTPDLV